MPLRFKKKRARRARLPKGIRIYAIGDVHGRVDLLDDVFSKIDNHLATDPAFRPVHVLLGDYVDRGPDSRATLDRLIERERHHEVVCLKGNHEAVVLEFLKNPSTLQAWQQFGGLQTLMSYGLAPPFNAEAAEQQELSRAFRKALPRDHLAFLSHLKPSFACGDYFFVHAGVRPGTPLNQQKEEDLLWIREDFLLCEDNFGKIVVHGHTPVAEPEIRTNRINIDTGAYATGRLTCLMLQDDTCKLI